MNRSMGLGTGAVLVFGVLLRAGTGGAPVSASEGFPPNPVSATLASSASTVETIDKMATKLSGEGPWTASCRYWQTSTRLQYPPEEGKDGQTTLEFQKDNGKLGAKVDSSASESKSECSRSGDAWGLPTFTTTGKQNGGTANITAIMAAVPDPVHTHLALMFDRDIDALLQAAAENGFLVSQYWLPWKSPEQGSASTATPGTNAEEAEQPQREMQPGLIILKYAPENADPQTYDWRSYNRVVYLFLVGESPASGMNGAQLRNALRYESMLKSRGADLSMRGPGDLAIIGSPNSGSAVSLRVAIEAANKALGATTVHIAGSTETEQANKALQLAFSGSTTPYITSPSAKTSTTRNTRPSTCSATPVMPPTVSPSWSRTGRSSATKERPARRASAVRPANAACRHSSSGSRARSRFSATRSRTRRQASSRPLISV